MTHIIKILGSGCTKCTTLFNLTKEVVEENHIPATIEKVEQIDEIMKYHIMITPALVLNGEVKVKGRVPSREELLQLLQSA
ncbi:MAG: thioredoxin family protein [Bacteroidetes bacterium]|nr:MAG: thioredoxin family protein [Bacteroidota bacterium]PIE87942.1 MAG: thioredoxin family protein [Bacteroidota bacterium]